MKLIILHTNDTHGYITPLPSDDGHSLGGYARRATFVEQQREAHEHVLLVDAGDFYQSSRYWHAFRGEADIALMNQLGYHVAALGNHDFDGGLDLLATRLRQAEFPVVCTNVTPVADHALAGLWSSSIIMRVDEFRIGFFSLLVDQLPLYPPEFEQAMILDPIHKMAQSLVEQLSDHTDALVLLSHLGHDGDVELASRVTGIDLIIGGHTHTPLHEPLVVNGTPIVRGIVGGQMIGRVELEVENDERSTLRSYELVALDDSFADHEEVAAEVAHWTARLPEERVLGELMTPIDTRQMAKAGGESAAGNLYADALLAGCDAAQVGVAHMGTLRGDRVYGPGPFTNLDLSEYHPFPNCSITRRLTGPQIKMLLEWGVSALPVAAARFLAIAGLTVRVDLERQPMEVDLFDEWVLGHGQRIQEVAYGGEILKLDDEGLALDVVMDGFMGKGGAGFFFLKDTPVIRESKKSGAEAVANLLTKHGSVSPQVGGRLLMR